MDIASSFLARVEAAIEAHGISPRSLGMEAIGDPSFVSRLRRRRNSPTLTTIDRIDKFIAGLERQAKKKRRA